MTYVFFKKIKIMFFCLMPILNILAMQDEDITNYQESRDRETVRQIIYQNLKELAGREAVFCKTELEKEVLVTKLMDQFYNGDQRFDLQRSLILLKKNNAIGFVNYSVTYPKIFKFLLPSAYIKSIAIAEDEKGKGYGKKLLNHALDDFKLQSVKDVILYTSNASENLQRFYEKFGFKEMPLNPGIGIRMNTSRWKLNLNANSKSMISICRSLLKIVKK